MRHIQCVECGAYLEFSKHEKRCSVRLNEEKEQHLHDNLEPKKESALDVQIGGEHYKKYAIQPVEYIQANGLGYFEGNVVKYVTRWRDKGGSADLQKAQHYLQLLIELEERRR